jgi:hypothetical protein
MELAWDNILSIVIILVLIFVGYSKLKNQTMTETLNEIKELLTGGKE